MNISNKRRIKRKYRIKFRINNLSILYKRHNINKKKQHQNKINNTSNNMVKNKRKSKIKIRQIIHRAYL